MRAVRNQYPEFFGGCFAGRNTHESNGESLRKIRNGRYKGVLMLADAVSCRHYTKGYCRLITGVACVKNGRNDVYCYSWQNWRTRDASDFKESGK